MVQAVDSITIKVAGKDDSAISAQSFLRVVQETIAILKELDPKGELGWHLTAASFNSPLTMTFDAQPVANAADWPAGVSRRYMGMLRTLDKGETPPDAFPAKAIIRAKKLIDVLNNGVAKLTFSSPGAESVTPTQRVQATVSAFEATKRDTYRDYSTLEGFLMTVSVDGGNRFFIRDRITGHRTACSIAHERLDEAKKALEHRVFVTGKVKYKGGLPMTVDVENFDVMPGRDKLPQWQDIIGIDFVGDEDSVEFIRRGRNGDEDSGGVLG